MKRFAAVLLLVSLSAMAGESEDQLYGPATWSTVGCRDKNMLIPYRDSAPQSRQRDAAAIKGRCDIVSIQSEYDLVSRETIDTVGGTREIALIQRHLRPGSSQGHALYVAWEDIRVIPKPKPAPPVQATAAVVVHDSCDATQKHGLLVLGCAYTGWALSDGTNFFKIRKAAPAVRRFFIAQDAALRGHCDDPADTVYIAYSPYTDGMVLVVRRGILMFRHVTDRARAKDYVERPDIWKGWEKRPLEFSPCKKLGTPMKRATATKP